MYNHTTKMLFMMTLIGGMMMTISSNSWLGAWMGLEINLLSFIPLMTNNENIFTTEASMKYFLVQALASSVLIFIVMMIMSVKNEILVLNKFTQPDTMLSLPLMLKMGISPLHWWFPSVMEGLTWLNCLILLTLQKIAPMLLMTNSLDNKSWIMISILMSVIVGSIGGLNQNSIRKMLAYSSINHMGWLLMAMYLSMSTWIIYFIIYVTMTLSIILVMSINQVSLVNQMFVNNIYPINKVMMFMVLMSMAGLPPFLGFLPKWLVIQSMVVNSYVVMSMIMITFSLITLYYYLRMMYAAILLNKSSISWMPPKVTQFNSSMLLSMVMSLLGMMLLPLPLTFYL
uniref:NADH dehydrogenase subunit 2 n=1 Tax=Sorineuchora bivitta TaxID=1928793 RepID=UPI0027A253E7|nr:NADH dehydrogenase subunit 2 [Sorineuchora bivitta]WGO57743.1 NADH dehydrogenase subunit 2 [Sorineuchora bivitta]